MYESYIDAFEDEECIECGECLNSCLYMDLDMDEGIKLNGKTVDTPNSQQRSFYVAMKLIRALQSNNNSMIAASCAYLANRQPTTTAREPDQRYRPGCLSKTRYHTSV